MSAIKRRQFLQFSGSALAAIGLSQLDLTRQANRYGRVLAQETAGTKRALLVGINGYSKAPLAGCVTDVLMQRELLIHRFGFAAENIVILADDASIPGAIAPTRDNIIQSFQQHLIEAASAEDVLVFHFSGHGSRVVDQQSGFEDQLNSTFVPIDREEAERDGQTYVSDITGKTLFLLMSQVPSDNLTVVLDSCHSGGGKRGNATVRATSGGQGYRRMQIEEDLQQKLQEALGYSDKELRDLRQQVAKGVVIASTQRQQLAADTEFDGFAAGAFTYALTQYLWQATDNAPIRNVVANVSRTTKNISFTGQIPEVEVKRGSQNDRQPAYFLERTTPPAEAVLSSRSGDEVRFWLGGIQPRSLPAFAPGSTFTMLDRDRQPQGRVQLERREGLMGIGRLLNGGGSTRSLLQPGLLMQEEVRAIPEDLPLFIGLDESLAAAEKQQARSALTALGQLIPAEIGAERQVIHYILGRMTPALRSRFQQEGVSVDSATNSIGLYDGELEVIPGTFGVAGESVTDAIARLRAKFRALLAARLLKLTLNADSARMKIAARMVVLNSGNEVEAIAADQFTVRGGARSLSRAEGSAGTSLEQVQRVNGIPQLPFGTRVRLEIENQEERSLYVSVIVVTSTGDLVLTFPNQWAADVEAAKVEAGSVRQLPDKGQGDGFDLTIRGPEGPAEILVVASSWPLRDSLRVAQQQAARADIRGGQLLVLENPKETIDQLLVDVDEATRQGPNARDRNLVAEGTKRVMDSAEIAAVSITFQAIKPNRVGGYSS